MLAVALVLLSMGGSGYTENKRLQTEEAQALAHLRCTSAPDTSCGDPQWWAARQPDSEPAQALKELATSDSRSWLAVGAGQELWAVNWAARVGAELVPTDAIDTVAVSTAALIGTPVQVHGALYAENEYAILSSLEPWNSLLRDRCGACAPPAQAMPEIDLPAQPSVIAPPGIKAPSVDLAAERIRRSAAPPEQSPVDLVKLVADIRSGTAVDPAVWSAKGLAGMAALELGRRGEPDALETLLSRINIAPSDTDAIAMSYAALRLLAENPGYQIPANHDAHLGAAMIRKLSQTPGAP